MKRKETKTEQAIEHEFNAFEAAILASTDKAIEYGYPTSDTAKKFGRYDEGVFLVSLYNGMSKTWTIKRAFDNFDAAKAYADTLELPYHKYSLKCLHQSN